MSIDGHHFRGRGPQILIVAVYYKTAWDAAIYAFISDYTSNFFEIGYNRLTIHLILQ